jgi:MFS transporter, ACDE family, multidrug resistance protein
MAIALVATLVPLPRTPKPAHPASLGEPLRALRHRGLLTMGVTALLYNWGFFTMLGYVPFPMGLSIYGLGAVFFGWGVLVAIFSVFVAPRLQTRFGTAPVLYVNLAMFAALLAVIATFTDSPATLATCVVVAGAFIGINNTLTTQAVMLVAPVERPVASAATSSSGSSAVAWPRGWPASWPSGSACPCPFYLGAVAVLLAAGVLATGHRLLARADEALAAGEAAHAGEADLDAAELEEVLEDGTGEAGARRRAEVPRVR